MILLLSSAFALPPVCAAEQTFHALVRPAHAPRHRAPPMEPVLRFAYDENDSGSLDEAERAALRKGLAARCASFAELVEVIDVDANGSLSEDERSALHSLVGPPPGPPPGPRGGEHSWPPPPLLHAYDTDGSGDLDEKERAVARADVRERLEAALPPFPHPSHSGGR